MLVVRRCAAARMRRVARRSPIRRAKCVARATLWLALTLCSHPRLRRSRASARSARRRRPLNASSAGKATTATRHARMALMADLMRCAARQYVVRLRSRASNFQRPNAPSARTRRSCAVAVVRRRTPSACARTRDHPLRSAPPRPAAPDRRIISRMGPSLETCRLQWSSAPAAACSR